jgi:two-component system sensor histidine kinase DesK
MNEDRESVWDWLGPLLGLLWLSFPIAAMAGEPQSRADIALAVVLGLVFGWLFVTRGPRTCTSPRRDDYLLIAVMAAIAALLTGAVGSEWAILFALVAVPNGLRLAPAQAFWSLWVLVALAGGLSLAGGGQGADEAATWAATTFGTGLLFIALGRALDANRKLRRAQAELAHHAVEEERLRFARDLHDLLGHSLSVIALKAELAGRLLPDRPADAAQHVGELESVARSALAEVREAVSGYRRPTLAGEVAGARVALEAAGIDTEVVADGEPGDPEAEAVLAWAVREGTTNVIRHSGASRVRIVVDGRSADIEDDGGDGSPTGLASLGAIAQGAILPLGGDMSGHGLAGLRERAERLGGRLEAGPRADGGFGLRVTLP